MCHEFRMSFKEPGGDVEYLDNWLVNISIDGQPLKSVRRITLIVEPDGVPLLHLDCIGDNYVEPLLKSIEIDTPVQLRVVTEERVSEIREES